MRSPLAFGWPTLLLLLRIVRGDEGEVGSDTVDNILGQNANQQPLSNPVEPSKYHPWSRKPYCFNAVNEGQPKLKSSRKEFCVHPFARDNGKSIGLITTPDLAKETVQFFNEDPVSIFLNEKQAERWHEQGPPFEIVPIEDKGLGVRATRKIKQYETFLFDQAAIVVDLTMEKLESEARHVTPERLLLRAVGQMNEKSAELVRGLNMSHFGEVDLERGGVLTQVIEKNAFGSSLRSGEVETKALFPLAARVNHACNPNSFIMFSPSGLSIGLKAYRDIAQGEEITISYLLLGMPSNQRHAHIHSRGFKCTCDLCSLPADKLAQSDSNRRRITVAEKELIAKWKDGKPAVAVKLAEEVVDLMKAEDLTPMLTDEYVMLAKLHQDLGDPRGRKEYAEMALDLLRDLGFLGTEAEDWDAEKLLEVYGDEAKLYRASPE